MSQNINKNRVKHNDEAEEGVEVVNWPVVLPLILGMITVFVAGFIALS